MSAIEGRHQLVRILFDGKRGELRRRYRKDQEDRLGALGIVVERVVLWSAIYKGAALSRLPAEGFDVRPGGFARLSKFGFKRINMLSFSAFILPETVARTGLGPLRDPNAAGIDEA